MLLPKDIQFVLNSLSRIPYENISKAVKYSTIKKPDRSVRMPDELLSDYYKYGTGGTCFSLTWSMYNYIKREGYSIYNVLCDRSYGKNTHCCSILKLNNKKYLLDPGFLSFIPMELKEINIIETPFNTIEIEHVDINRYKLSTIFLNNKKYRFTLKDIPVSDKEFIDNWYKSFEMESLTYPVVTMLKKKKHLYLQKNNLYIRTREGSNRIVIPKEKFPEIVNNYFGINADLCKKSLEVFF